MQRSVPIKILEKKNFFVINIKNLFLIYIEKKLLHTLSHSDRYANVPNFLYVTAFKKTFFLNTKNKY